MYIIGFRLISQHLLSFKSLPISFWIRLLLPRSLSCSSRMTQILFPKGLVHSSFGSCFPCSPTHSPRSASSSTQSTSSSLPPTSLIQHVLAPSSASSPPPHEPPSREPASSSPPALIQLKQFFHAPHHPNRQQHCLLALTPRLAEIHSCLPSSLLGN